MNTTDPEKVVGGAENPTGVVPEEQKNAEATTVPENEPSVSEHTAVNVLILAPMNFEGSKASVETFLRQCSAAPSKISSICPITLDATTASFGDEIENLQTKSYHAQYSSVKENHLDQAQSTREIRISEGNRITSDNRQWYLTQVWYPYEVEAVSCVLHFNSNMKPIYYFDESVQSNLFVLVGLAKTMDMSLYVDKNASDVFLGGGGDGKSEASSLPFNPFVIHPPFPVIVDTINGAVPFSSQELLFTNGLKDYVNLKLNSGRCTRRTVCKHFDPFQKIQCRYGTNCHFIHIKESSMDRVLQPATLYPPLRLPKLEDDLQISTCENSRRQDTLVLRYLPKATTAEDVDYMFQECEGFLGSYFQLNEFYSSAIIRFDSIHSATRALLQAAQNELNISFYGAVEDLKALLITDARECNYPAVAIERLPGDKTKRKEDEEKARRPVPSSDELGGKHERGKYRSDRPDSQFRHRRHNDWSDAEHGYGGDKRRRPYDASGYNHRPRENSTEGSYPPAGRVPTESSTTHFPELPQGWTHQVNTKGTQFYFYAIGHEDNTTWYHPISKQMYYA
ncbi:Estrogen sulfotransferase testis [Perkinsela sp. CCAP 1560/4]|nr:Estrogen sulfotransferase testis [Perkinsela sp. CCAP 1560/4]|eukprot:KNH06399.1 Estrogen sulfotransferase testis [Perkinsela sp. CCAP 1560/4]